MKAVPSRQNDREKPRRSPGPKGLVSSSRSKEFEVIPGIGPSMAVDLEDLGFKRVADLRGADPEMMFDKLCALRGAKIDRYVLYVFRRSVYYAEHDQHDLELLKWWNWKDD